MKFRSELLFVLLFFLGSFCHIVHAIKTEYCPPLPPSTHPNQIYVDPSMVEREDFVRLFHGAQPYTTFIFRDGIYNLKGKFIWISTPHVTLRSETGLRGSVILDGNYETTSIITIAASDVIVAHMSLRNCVHHPVHVVASSEAYSDTDNTLLFDLFIRNPGQQAIKVNSNFAKSYFTDRGTIACCEIELTDSGRQKVLDFNKQTCYTGGIDIHMSQGWIIRDNIIRGFWCTKGLSEHAIHLWTGSRDTTIERNTLFNNARGIGLGLGDKREGRRYADDICGSRSNGVDYGHYGAVVRSNAIVQNSAALFASQASYECAVCLEKVCNVRVVHNSIYSDKTPFSSIEYRFADTQGVLVSNNLHSHHILARDGATATLQTNVQVSNATAVYASFSTADLHLQDTPSVHTLIRSQGTSLPASLCPYDIDGGYRQGSSKPDIGCDQYNAFGQEATPRFPLPGPLPLPDPLPEVGPPTIPYPMGSFCPAFIPMDRTQYNRTVRLTPGDIVHFNRIFHEAKPDTLFLFEKGTYNLQGKPIYITTPRVTLRSETGRREDVILDGNYQTLSIISIVAPDVTVASLTVTHARAHGIHVMGSHALHVNTNNTVIYDIHAIDNGQQQIKGNQNYARTYFTDFGLVACSLIELSPYGRAKVWEINKSCYTGGIDIHTSRGWHIRDNHLQGFYCPRGCSEHAIHFWTGSRDTLVERNYIKDCHRGIGFGLGEGTVSNKTKWRLWEDRHVACPGDTTYPFGHYGGVIQNNVILQLSEDLYATRTGYDAGIALEQVCGTRVLHNTVFARHSSFSSIEWRFGHTNNVIVANNLVSGKLRPRSVQANAAKLQGNAGVTQDMLVDVLQGNFHVAGTQAAKRAVLGKAVSSVTGASLPLYDFDGGLVSSPRDVGADQRGAKGDQANPGIPPKQPLPKPYEYPPIVRARIPPMYGAFCPPYPAFNASEARGPVRRVRPSDVSRFLQIFGSAAGNTTFLFEDGVYDLRGKYIWISVDGVTLRSASGNRSRVILDGGYMTKSIIGCTGSGLSVISLTLKRTIWHPIHIMASKLAPRNVDHPVIYDVHIEDPGQQAIKVNANSLRTRFVDHGTIACNHIELTNVGRQRVLELNGKLMCYTGGIDVHQARGWVVRDNFITGFWCHRSLSEHAIHFWTGSRDTLIERNILTNNARGIGLGLGQGKASAKWRTYEDKPCPTSDYWHKFGHYNATVKNNMIVQQDAALYASQAGYEVGIGLEDACGVQVLHNTVWSDKAGWSSIEWRFEHTRDIQLWNNLASGRLLQREGARASLHGNQAVSSPGLFRSVERYDFHGVNASAVPKGLALPAYLTAQRWCDVRHDVDGEARVSPPYAGADTYTATLTQVQPAPACPAPPIIAPAPVIELPPEVPPLPQHPVVTRFCPPVPPSTGFVVRINPGIWMHSKFSDAFLVPGTTYEFAPGVYYLDSVMANDNIFIRTPNVTLRSQTGRREDVILDGVFKTGSVISIQASNVAIYSMTFRNFKSHAIHIYPESDATEDVTGTVIYDIQVLNPGQQAIHVNPNSARTHFVDGGLIACSAFELNDRGREYSWRRNSGCYTGAVDLMGGKNWVVRDNTVRGFWCERELAQPALVSWAGSYHTIFERNYLIDNAQGIGFGGYLGTSATSEHRRHTYDTTCSAKQYPYMNYKGIARNNYVLQVSGDLYASQFRYHRGIVVEEDCGTKVVHNTVYSKYEPWSSIEWGNPATSAVEVLNNLISHGLYSRLGGRARVEGNLEADPVYFMDVFKDDYRLNRGMLPENTPLMYGGVEIEQGVADYDVLGKGRDRRRPDVGAENTEETFIGTLHPAIAFPRAFELPPATTDPLGVIGFREFITDGSTRDTTAGIYYHGPSMFAMPYRVHSPTHVTHLGMVYSHVPQNTIGKYMLYKSEHYQPGELIVETPIFNLTASPQGEAHRVEIPVCPTLIRGGLYYFMHVTQGRTSFNYRPSSIRDPSKYGKRSYHARAGGLWTLRLESLAEGAPRSLQFKTWGQHPKNDYNSYLRTSVHARPESSPLCPAPFKRPAYKVLPAPVTTNLTEAYSPPVNASAPQPSLAGRRAAIGYYNRPVPPQITWPIQSTRDEDVSYGRRVMRLIHEVVTHPINITHLAARYQRVQQDPTYFKLALYTDRDGYPHKLLAETAIYQVPVFAAPPARRVETPVVKPIEIPPGKYWLGHWLNYPVNSNGSVTMRGDINYYCGYMPQLTVGISAKQVDPAPRGLEHWSISRAGNVALQVYMLGELTSLKATKAYWPPTGQEMRVEFNFPTNRAGQAGGAITFPCSAVFDAMNSQFTCSWLNDRVISIKTPDTYAYPGDMDLAFKTPSAVRTKPIGGCPQCDTVALLTTSIRTTSPSPVAPALKLQAPEDVGACETVRFRAVGTETQTKARKFEWTLLRSRPVGLDTVALETALQSATTGNQEAVALPQDTLPQGAYMFRLRVTDWFNAATEAQFRLRKTEQNAMRAYMNFPDEIVTIPRLRPTVLRPMLRVTSCSYREGTTPVKYKWTGLNPASEQLLTARRIPVNRGYLNLPRGAMEPGTSYGFQVNVTVRLPHEVLSDTSRARFATVLQPLQACIIGGAHQSFTSQEELILTSACSFDPESYPRGAKAQFNWTVCLLEDLTKTVCNTSQVLPSAFKTKFLDDERHPVMRIRAPGITGHLGFTLTMLKGDRFDRTFVHVHLIEPPATPRVRARMAVQPSFDGTFAYLAHRLFFYCRISNLIDLTDPQVQWTMTEGDFDLAQHPSAVFGQSSQRLLIAPFALPPRAYTVQAKVTTIHGQDSKASYAFTVAAPPDQGYLGADPQSPRVGQDETFTLVASGYNAESGTLLYKFYQNTVLKSGQTRIRDLSPWIYDHSLQVPVPLVSFAQNDTYCVKATYLESPYSASTPACQTVTFLPNDTLTQPSLAKQAAQLVATMQALYAKGTLEPAEAARFLNSLRTSASLLNTTTVAALLDLLDVALRDGGDGVSTLELLGLVAQRDDLTAELKAKLGPLMQAGLDWIRARTVNETSLIARMTLEEIEGFAADALRVQESIAGGSTPANNSCDMAAMASTSSSSSSDVETQILSIYSAALFAEESHTIAMTQYDLTLAKYDPMGHQGNYTVTHAATRLSLRIALQGMPKTDPDTHTAFGLLALKEHNDEAPLPRAVPPPFKARSRLAEYSLVYSNGSATDPLVAATPAQAAYTFMLAKGTVKNPVCLVLTPAGWDSLGCKTSSTSGTEQQVTCLCTKAGPTLVAEGPNIADQTTLIFALVIVGCLAVVLAVAVIVGCIVLHHYRKSRVHAVKPTEHPGDAELQEQESHRGRRRRGA